MTIGMAYELKPRNIAVVGLVPGWMRTEAVMSGKPPYLLPATAKDLAWTESVEYVGRAVAALATDPNLMEKAGCILHTRDLGRECGFTDVDGKEPLFYEGCEGWSAT